MKKIKLLLATATLMLGGSVWAQTDVTSTYLTNADFETDEALTTAYLYGYGKDGSPYGFQTVTGWTSVVTNGASDGGYANSAMAGGVFSYGSSTQLKGNAKAAPATNPDGEATGKCFGFFGVWGCGGYYYQTVTLAPGAYTITIPMYNQSGTQANTTYTGFFPTSGTNQTVAVNPAVGSWVNQTVSFTLEAATEGQIRIGYQSTGNGSGSNPHIFIDCVKIECSPFATAADYEAMNTAISTVEGTTWGFDAGEYAPYNYVEVIEALAAAKAIDQDANNSQATVQALTTTLNTSMTANAAEVNAIWDPSFEYGYSTSGNVQPIAWTGTSGHDNATDVRWMWNVSSNAGLGAVSSNKALFTKYGVFYGQQTGYTLPLNADTYYTIAFKYGGWSDCKKDGYVTMSDPNSTGLSLIPSNRLPLDAVDGNSNTASWKDYQSFFKTSVAGNYVLGLRKDNENQQSQYVYGDFVLKQTTVAEATAYYNSVLDEVDDDYDDYANGGSEKTAFKTALDADVSGYTVAQLMEAAANLYTLRDDFVAATPKYEAFATAATAATPNLLYAATAKKEAVNSAKSATAPTTATEAETKTAAITTALRAYYESNAMAEGYAGAVNLTYLLTNYNNPSNTSGWTVNNKTGSSNMRIMNNESYTDADGTNNHSYFDSNSWGSAFTSTFTQDVELPAGTYILTAKARGNGTTTYQVVADGEATDISSIGNTGGVFGRGWNDYTVEFELDAKQTVTLGINMETGNSGNWLSFGDFRLYSLTAVTESVTVTAAGYATFSSPYALDFTGKDIKAYIATANGTAGVNFNLINKVPANTGVLLCKEGGTDSPVDVPVFDGTGADATTGNVFVPGTGVAVASEGDGKKNYILSSTEAHGVGFYPASGKTVNEGKAYISVPASVTVKGFITLPDFEDDATGINAIDNGELTIDNAAIYNLAGQRISKMQKGINIVNGKKILK